MSKLLRTTCLSLALFASGLAHAVDAPAPQAMPDWDALTPAQQETLVKPLRERWNQKPEDRARMYERAVRWQSLSPEQRARAHRGMKRWEHMDPERRAQMKALFESTRDMPRSQRRETMALFHAMLPMSAEEREALRQKWGQMSPEERTQWMRENAPRRKGHHRHPGPRDAGSE